jgi:2-methylcitrate dehydratase PrpD
MVALYATDKIANYVASLSPGAVTESQLKAVARALIDTYAVAIAARHEPGVKAVQTYVAGHSGPVIASQWANGAQLPIELAALVNGYTASVLEFDDEIEALHAGISAVAMPALCAVAEAVGAQGRQLAAAYTGTFEVAMKLARALGNEPFHRGWHIPSTIGLIATTAGCAFLASLSKAQISHALGLAAAFAGGSQEQAGTMGNAMQVGQAAASALRAMQLARMGVQSSPSALDGNRGFATLLARDSALDHFDTMGRKPLEMEFAGIDIKKYPCSYATHRAIEAALELRSEYGITVNDIVGVEVTAQRNGLRPLVHPRAVTGTEARFSMHYALAAAFLDGKVKLASFADSEVQRPEAQAFYDRITLFEDEEGEEFPHFALVKLILKNGTTVERRVESAHGTARKPLSDGELADKARECFLYGKTEVWAKDFVNVVLGMASTPIRDVLRAGRMG